MGLFGSKKPAEVEVIDAELKVIEADFKRELAEVAAVSGLSTFSGEGLMPIFRYHIDRFLKLVRDVKILEIMKTKAHDPKYQRCLRGHLKTKEEEILGDINGCMGILRPSLQAVTDGIKMGRVGVKGRSLDPEKKFLERLIADFNKLRETTQRILEAGG